MVIRCLRPGACPKAPGPRCRVRSSGLVNWAERPGDHQDTYDHEHATDERRHGRVVANPPRTAHAAVEHHLVGSGTRACRSGTKRNLRKTSKYRDHTEHVAHGFSPRIGYQCAFSSRDPTAQTLRVLIPLRAHCSYPMNHPSRGGQCQTHGRDQRPYAAMPGVADPAGHRADRQDRQEHGPGPAWCACADRACHVRGLPATLNAQPIARWTTGTSVELVDATKGSSRSSQAASETYDSRYAERPAAELP